LRLAWFLAKQTRLVGKLESRRNAFLYLHIRRPRTCERKESSFRYRSQAQNRLGDCKVGSARCQGYCQRTHRARRCRRCEQIVQRRRLGRSVTTGCDQGSRSCSHARSHTGQQDCVVRWIFKEIHHLDSGVGVGAQDRTVSALHQRRRRQLSAVRQFGESFAPEDQGSN
jgi:hypothetical protein